MLPSNKELTLDTVIKINAERIFGILFISLLRAYPENIRLPLHSTF